MKRGIWRTLLVSSARGAQIASLLALICPFFNLKTLNKEAL